jgi:hypothetical protein
MQGRAQLHPAHRDARYEAGDRRRLELDTERFDQLVKAFLGDLKDYEVGQLFGYDDSVWSLHRTNKRYVNTHMIAICMELFPDVPTKAYCRSVPYQRRSEP